MLDKAKIESMIYLLDDSDERVVQQVTEELQHMGSEVLPLLEQIWPEEQNPECQEALISLITSIQQNTITAELLLWIEKGAEDLLEGLLIINKIADPNIDRQVIENKIDKIKLDAWLELNYDLTSFEKVKILNHIFFEVHQFEGDTEEYHHSKNLFIGSVLDRKKGNPVGLAIVYSLVAQRLNIPIYGVNLPQHFVLGYVKDFDWPPLLRFNDPSAANNEPGSDIMFYINPFNKGLIFNKENIFKFLDQLKLEPKEDYFRTSNNKEIVLRVLRNLEVSFAKESNHKKLEIVKRCISAGFEQR